MFCDLFRSLSQWSCNNTAEKFYDGECTFMCVCVCVSSVPAISSGYTASHLTENPRSVRRLSELNVTDTVSLALTRTGGRM